MAKTNGKTAKEMVAEQANPLFEATRKVMLASMGAVALAQEEAENFLNKLVERGEIAEKDARKLMREMMDRRTKASREDLDKRIEMILDRMNVPTKADIEMLGEKIAILTKKVDELKRTPVKVEEPPKRTAEKTPA
jgi:poly(hydroxyalkanoate) granule-associated protein